MASLVTSWIGRRGDFTADDAAAAGEPREPGERKDGDPPSPATNWTQVLHSFRPFPAAHRTTPRPEGRQLSGILLTLVKRVTNIGDPFRAECRCLTE